MKLFSSKQPALSLAGEWLIVFTAFWFLGGLFMDGWAHNHVPELESFFTPWHAMFYSGFFAMIAVLVGMTLLNRAKTNTWKDAIPLGYDIPLLGAVIFFIGGIGDLIWHELLGIEASIEALLSPTHLVLATGMTMMLSGGLASWWHKNQQERDAGLIAQLPMILSATFIVSLFSFMTQYSHVVDLIPTGPTPEDAAIFWHYALAISGYQLHFLIIMGMLFFLMRQGKLAFGAVTIMLTLNILAMGLMRMETFAESIPLAIGAAFTGLVADTALPYMYPLEKYKGYLRLFAFGIPAVFFAFYFAYLMASQGIWWSVHMWAGSIFYAGVASLLLSFIVWLPEKRNLNQRI